MVPSEMRIPHPPIDPHLLRRSSYRAPLSLHTRLRAGLPPVARPQLLALRWLPGLAVPHGAAVAAVPGATAG